MMDRYDPDCWSCQHMLGVREVSLVPRIYQGTYWNVEHVPETSVPGWIVLVLRRHVASLHELKSAEFSELGELLDICSQAVHEIFSSEKEYVMQFAESDNFQHVHFHIVPKPKELPGEFHGPRIFGALGLDDEMSLSREQMTAAAEKISNFIEGRKSSHA